MKFGLSPQDRELIESIFRKEIPNPVGIRVYIFGSRVGARYQKYSDVDLLLEGGPLPAETLSTIAERLEESVLPYKVDLVDARKLAPEYAESVNRTKQLFFSI
ncbi:MAG: nucleotidyltransferase domain-containing protein [Pseudomonadota bacterium]